uniref:16S rRNA (Cytosine(1402)-N(4))-methyltransferase n=1 Tax=Leptocylindrus danicus TaxID=163516 RepID=A0A7S2KSA8_9STRA|mmetsp:Transcript_25307/g.37843  ORF Transcript_25307/g.37843 Transcript_25307/m.37843 type:complete len:219 (+) Transcript_25307:58-714(+)
MRMDNSRNDQMTAADICNEYGENGIIEMLRTFADESTPRARKIAKSIIDNRPHKTTTDLVNAVAAVTPEFAKKSRRMGRTATLARVFQAMRMIVNEEDSSLTEALAIAAPSVVRPGGRLAVLTYHSLEDRATKRVMKDGHDPWLSVVDFGVSPLLDKKARRTTVEKDLYGNELGPPKPWKIVGKPQKAAEAEVEANGRARSATLRVAERLCADGTTFN